MDGSILLELLALGLSVAVECIMGFATEEAFEGVCLALSSMYCTRVEEIRKLFHAVLVRTLVVRMVLVCCAWVVWCDLIAIFLRTARLDPIDSPASGRGH